MKLNEHNKKMRMKSISITLLILFIAGAITADSTISSHKSNFIISDTVKYKDFTIRVIGVKANSIKLGALDPFYQAVWGRTENDIADCSSQSAERVRYSESPKNHCERTNNDIRRDLASKVGIAQYLNDNERIDVTYTVVSKSNSMQVNDIHAELVSGEEGLAQKTFKYAFIYTDENEIRSSNDIVGGSLTRGLARTGLAWADVKKNTPAVDVKVTYKGVIKSISIQQPFKY